MIALAAASFGLYTGLTVHYWLPAGAWALTAVVTILGAGFLAACTLLSGR